MNLIFVNAKQLKKKDGNPFYLINAINEEEQEIVTAYPNATNFKKIVDKKPIYMKKYNFVYENVVKFGKIQPELTDILDIK